MLQILTSDNAAIEVGADVYYRIYDAILSINRIKDLDMSTRVLSQTMLQTSLAKQTLADIECNKQTMSQVLLVCKAGVICGLLWHISACVCVHTGMDQCLSNF